MDSSKKSNKIREIVRLQQLLKKWRKQASSSKANNNNTNTTTATTTTNSSSNGSKSIKFLKRTLSLSERSGGDASSNAVPKGFLAVSVGEEQRRFTIPTEYLGHQAFGMLLREAEEEFGFQQAGVLRIPCDVPMFESILKMVEEKKDAFATQDCRFGIDDAIGCYPSDSPLSQSHHPQSPMCR